MSNYPYNAIFTPLDTTNLERINGNWRKIEADISSLDSKYSGITTSLSTSFNAELISQRNDYTSRSNNQYADYTTKLGTQKAEYTNGFKVQKERIDGIVNEVSGEAFDLVVDSAKVNWLSPVATSSDLTTTYPSAVAGDASQTLDNNKIYRFNGSSWVFIQNFGAGPFTDIYRRFDEIALNVKEYGAVGDGVTDDTLAIQNALDDLVQGGRVFFPTGTYIISDTLTFSVNEVCLEGNNAYVKSANGTDIIIFEIANLRNVSFVGINSSNTITAQTFIKATTVHHLYIKNANFDGMKLGFDLYDCYWTKLSSVRMQSVYQAWKFNSATNAFHLENVSVNGAGVYSVINDVIGGNIIGCSFEGASGRLDIVRGAGLNIEGNYFEGYDATNIADYIKVGSGNYKDTLGINISGNLFYGGAQNGVTLYNVDGVKISGNYFGTTHAVRLYSFDDSNQTNVSYEANHFTGVESAEINVWGSITKASVSVIEKAPRIMNPIVSVEPIVTGNQISTFNRSGVLKQKKNGLSESGFGTARKWFGQVVSSGQVMATTSSVLEPFNKVETLLLIVSTSLTVSTQNHGVYLIQRNFNSEDKAFVVPIVNNPSCTVVTEPNRILIENTDGVERYMDAKLLNFAL